MPGGEIMPFEFATATRILFGAGTLNEIGPAAKNLGQRALIITGRQVNRAFGLIDRLQAAGVSSSPFPISGEPTTDIVAAGVQFARENECDVVIGFGGGSAIDAAKAIAALLTNDGELFDYLEVIGRAQPLTQPAAPCICIPTTAGTGAEVTRNAVLSSPKHRVKVSLRSPFMLPRLALIDPELTLDLPPKLTATTGLDALTQLVEPFVSIRANPLTDGLCREGIQRVARSLRRACETVAPEARKDLALASLFSGLALANAGLGAVHGFAAPIGGMFDAPHGAICAALLPHVMAVNIAVLRDRATGGEALERYHEVGRLLTGQSTASADDGVAWVQQLCRELGIGGLGSFGVTCEVIPNLIAHATQASSMRANPIALTPHELEAILTSSL